MIIKRYMHKYYKIKIELKEEEVYEIVPILPEHIADEIIKQVERVEAPRKQPKEYFRQYYLKNRDKQIKRSQQSYKKRKKKQKMEGKGMGNEKNNIRNNSDSVIKRTSKSK